MTGPPRRSALVVGKPFEYIVIQPSNGRTVRSADRGRMIRMSHTTVIQPSNIRPYHSAERVTSPATDPKPAAASYDRAMTTATTARSFLLRDFAYRSATRRSSRRVRLHDLAADPVADVLPLALRLDEPGLHQLLQVVRDRRLRHRELLTERLIRALPGSCRSSPASRTGAGPRGPWRSARTGRGRAGPWYSAGCTWFYDYRTVGRASMGAVKAWTRTTSDNVRLGLQPRKHPRVAGMPRGGVSSVGAVLRFCQTCPMWSVSTLVHRPITAPGGTSARCAPRAATDRSTPSRRFPVA